MVKKKMSWEDSRYFELLSLFFRKVEILAGLVRYLLWLPLKLPIQLPGLALLHSLHFSTDCLRLAAVTLIGLNIPIL